MNSKKNMEDSFLIASFVSGDNDAFKILLYRYKDALYRYIYLLVGDRDLADDFFQDTFIKAIDIIKSNRYVDKGYFYTWISRIARNMIFDYFRSSSRQKTFQIFEDNLLNMEDKSASDFIDYDAQERVFDELNVIIKSLSYEQQEVVNLRLYEDMSFRQIAEKLGISINTVLGRFRYAVINMRKLAANNQILSDYNL